MATLKCGEARACVIDRVRAAANLPPIERVPLAEAEGRVLARDVTADRDYPPVAKSIRDGYAVRSPDLPGRLRISGEVRAGERYSGEVGEGQAVEIMTGAPMPPGADAVVMIEHAARDGGSMTTDRTARPGEFVNPKGSECQRGDIVAARGKRLTYADIAVLATVGVECPEVYARPRIAILATGDEIVENAPEPWQIRNSNARSLAAQVKRAGGLPEILPVARDTYESTRELTEEGLKRDLLLLSGGVSAGKYDVVEQVLADLGAVFYFDRVLIQPGQPLVFGQAREKFFFGLPGNPASTMVTFRVFAQAAVELAGGQAETNLSTGFARLAAPFRHKPGLTRFLPARLANGVVTPVEWQGSSDVAALARANAFLIADENRESWETDDWIEVLLQ